jgi:hypothetical protein
MDPIYQAIESYGNVVARLDALLTEIGDCQKRHRSPGGSLPDPDQHPRLAALLRQEIPLCEQTAVTANAFARCVPTTAAGAVAAIKFVNQRCELGDDVLNCALIEPGQYNTTCRDVFLKSLRVAMGRFVPDGMAASEN